MEERLRMNKIIEQLSLKYKMLNSKIILFSVLGFFISRINFASGFVIFSVPYLIICSKNKIRTVILDVILLLGVVSAGKYDILLKLFFLILVTTHIGGKEQKEKPIFYVTLKYASLFLAISIIIDFLFLNGSLITFGIAVVQFLLIFTSSIILNKAMKYMLNVRNLTYLSTEVVVSCSFLAVACLIGMQDIYIYGVYLQEILIFLLIQVLTRAGGSIVGGLSGTIFSITLLIGEGYHINMSILSLIGIIMGLFKKVNKLMYSFIFTIFVLLVNALYSDSIFTSLNFISTILAAQIFFILIPERVFETLERMYEESIKIRRKEYYIKVKERISTRLLDYSSKFKYISKIFEKLGEQDKAKDENKNLIDNTIRNICDGCDQKEKCWEENFYSTYKSILEIFNVVQEEAEYKEEAKFGEICKNSERIYQEIYDESRKLEESRYLENKMQKAKQMFSKYLFETGEIIDKLSDDILTYKIFRTHIEDQIKEELERLDIYLEDIVVISNEQERYEIDMVIHRKDEENLKRILEICSRATGKLAKVAYSSETRDQIRFKIVEKEKYTLEYGIYQIAKDNSVCGDSYCVMNFPNGQALVAVSDGMGMGENAKRESKLALELLEYLTASNFREEFVVDIINSVLISNNKEFFTTLDTCIIDLYTGFSKFIKNGSVMTFIKRNDGVNIVRSENLPVGILDNIETKVMDGMLKKDDTIIMITDGAIDNINSADKKEEYFCSMIESIRMDEREIQDVVDILSDKILKYNFIKDDMTILAVKVK